MKKLLCIILCAVFIIILIGCDSLEIDGISNFNEEDCHFGLNDNLLPNNRAFLTDYPYDTGDYHYWQNGWLEGYAQAKTFVQLVYSEEVYQRAKLACTEYFVFSEEQYFYDALTFCVVNPAGGNLSLDTAFPGVRLLGYNDELYTLVFIAYMDDQPDKEQLNASNFSSFIEEQFGVWLK